MPITSLLCRIYCNLAAGYHDYFNTLTGFRRPRKRDIDELAAVILPD
ncbi:Protein of unknown function [Pyronema omphalodes CBS 100304]|uniref:Uncharacterized protein n=1 Tax=Pyronema omphalodes (strain CBS 100304) TaxID=1076935 RepID=U4LWZ5_PYROM|nr:Protein of unknown function [Pyronema omphalodes CBS 100304]